MSIDDETLELLERRMAERVESRVRSRLFAAYGLIGGGILAAFGWFGYDVVRDFRATVDQEAREFAVEAANNAVSNAVDTAEKAAADARSAAAGADEEARRARARLQALEEWRVDGQAKLRQTLEKVGDISNDIDYSLTAIQSKLDDADGRIDQLRDKSKNTYLGGEYAEVIKKLADEVARLDVELAKLGSQMVTPLVEPLVEGDDIAEPDGDIAATRQSQEIQQNVHSLLVGGPSTIFFQFAGGVTREEAQAIARGLIGFGYVVPGEERISTAAGLREIRYFFEEDAERATDAAGAVNEVLSGLGYRADVSVKSLTNFAGGKPRPGVLELWLEPRRPS